MCSHWSNFFAPEVGLKRVSNFDWLFMLGLRLAIRRIHSKMSPELYSRSHLDTTPPPYNGPLSPLDKSAFKKSLPVLAVRVPAAQTATILHSEATRKYVSDLRHILNIVRVFI